MDSNGTSVFTSVFDGASVYDVVVIGGGPAGLSAALVLSRARRTVLVVDSGEPRNAPAEHLHNYLTRDGTPPSELLAAGRAEVAGYGGQVITGTVVEVQRRAGGFLVRLREGDPVMARRILVATGVRDELPDIPGLAERWGRDVLHCPYCHGWEVRDRAVGILATGPMAVHAALLWRQWTDDVTLFRHTAPDFDDADLERFAARDIRVVDGTVVGLEITDDRLAGVRLASGEVVPRDALVVSSRMTARADALAALGLSTSDHRMGDHVVASYVPQETAGATDVPGVWVAGNVTDPMGMLITAAADGARAGGMINADLVNEDTAAAVERFRKVPAS